MPFGTPGTIWPGQATPGAYIPPASTFFNTTHGSPIFGGRDSAPQYTGPFNVNMGAGPMGQSLQMLMPMLMQQLMTGTGRSPYQFFPTHDLYTQMQANRYFADQQQAMSRASGYDSLQFASTLQGATRLWTGREPTAQETIRNNRLGRQFSSALPYIAMAFGPDVADQLAGSRGSAGIMAQQVQAALRTAVDPFTGRVGYSGAGAGTISQEIYARHFAPGADLSRMRGMSAGQFGLLANELQSRGMLGSVSQLGPASIDAIRSRGSGFYDDAFIARAADRDPVIQGLRDRGENITAQHLSDARARVRGTRDRVLGSGGAGLSISQLERMPGGEDMLRAGDARVIGQRLESLSGVVRAMRDVFGDMGNPNAPMHEIINGLQNLTQGGLAHMSPGELETMVRRTQAMARQTGIGMQGAIAMGAQGAGLADQFGVHRSIAMHIRDQSGYFGAGARDTQNFGRPAWGQLTLDQVTLGDQRMRTLAAASPVANNLNAVLRMADAGMIPAQSPGDAPRTEAQAIVQAVRAGQTTYQWGGRSRSLQLSADQVRQIVGRDHGVNDGNALSILADRTGNQQFGNQTVDVVRRLQQGDAANFAGNAFSAPLSQRLANGEGFAALQATGLVRNGAEARTFAQSVANGMGTDFLAMSDATVRDPAARRHAFGNAARLRIREQVAARLPPGTSDVEINRRTLEVMQALGGRSGLNSLAEAQWAALGGATAGTVAGSGMGYHQLHGGSTAEAARRRELQGQVDASMSAALSSLGGIAPGARAIDALTNARAGAPLREVLSEALGGIDINAITAADPSGSVAGIMGVLTENQSLNPSNATDHQRLARNAIILRGLAEGGDAARAALTYIANNTTLPRVSEQIIRQLRNAVDRGSVTQQLRAAGHSAGPSEAAAADTRATEQFAALPGAQQHRDVVARLIEAADPASRQTLRNARGDLLREVSRGERAAGLDAGLRAQDRLVQLAASHGLYGFGRTVASLTPEERANAANLLKDAVRSGQINPQDAGDVTRWIGQAQGLQGFGPGATPQDAIRRIQNYGEQSAAGAGTTAAGGSSQPVRAMVVSGSVTLTADNRVQFNNMQINPMNEVSSST